MNIFKSLLGCTLLLALMGVPAQADIVTPADATATSSFGFNPPTLLIDSSGLDGVGPVQDQLHDNVEANNWQVDVFAPPPTNEVDLVFTLDGTYDLSGAHIWNFNNIAGQAPDLINVNFRGVKEFSLSVSPNLVDAFSPVGNFTLNQANVTSDSTSDPEPAQFVGFAANAVRRVKFEIISNFSGDASPPIDDPVVGLSEVRFEGIRIPEPTTLALGALSILALAGRRRRH